MAAIETLVRIILALAVVAFVAYPLLRESQETDEEVGELSEEAEDLYRRKESTYSALKELEFDFKTGKLSKADFEELDAKYRGDALEILGAIDLYESGATATSPAQPTKRERAVKSESQGLGSRSGRSVHPAPVRAAQAVALAGLDPEACVCGSVNVEGAKFCAACGEPLEEQLDLVEPGDEQPVCAACGAELEAWHRFCVDCGARAQT